jgi:hypothetical protein
MTEIVKAQRVRIIREVEAAAVYDKTGKLPWRASWATYFGDRAGLLDALATRRQCLSIIRVDDLPAGTGGDVVARQITRTSAGLDRILLRYGAPGALVLAETA